VEKDKYHIPLIEDMILKDPILKENKFLIIHSWTPTDPEYQNRLDYSKRIREFIKSFHQLETKIETHCDECDKERVFTSKKPVLLKEDWRKSNAGLGICSEGLVIFEFECTMNTLHRRFYIFRTSYDAITKIGQHPSFRQEVIDTLNLGSIKEELFPFELINGTRGYLEQTAKQALLCYDQGIYDGSLVLIRRLIETLIIECFEAYDISERVKDSIGDFFQFKNFKIHSQTKIHGMSQGMENVLLAQLKNLVI